MDKWTYNFAAKPNIRDRIKEYFVPKIKTIRETRFGMEEEWERFYNMWSVKHDENHNYRGRSQLYVPEVRKNVESQSRQITESAFPTNNYLTCVPGKTGTRMGSELQLNIRKWQIHQAGLRIKFQVYARQSCLYGTSPVYVPWRKQTETVFRRLLSKNKTLKIGREEVDIFNGPDFVVKDLFKWYTFNPKKPDILEDGCFEIQVLTESEIKNRKDLFGLDKMLQGSSDAYSMTELERDVRRMEDMGLQLTTTGSTGIATINNNEASIDSTYISALIFTKINLPEATESGEDPNKPIPVLIEIINNEHVGIIKRNPFWHQRPPYLAGKYILPNPDEFYGQGIPKAIQYMQYEINSKSEQCMDAGTYALNPITIIDPGLASQTSEFNMEPGAQWFCDPKAVKFGNMPDTTATGYQAISLIRSQMQEYSDRAPALPPQLLGKSRTATQSNIVNSAVQVDNKTFQLTDETLVLNPLMEMWESLTDQNIEEDQVIMIMGNQSKQWRRVLVPKNASLGQYQYFWKGSGSIGDRAILGRSIIDMLKVTAVMPPEDRMRLNIDYSEIFRMLWTNAYQLPDADKLFGQREQETTDPELEHKMVEIGINIEVLPGDNDPEHMKAHDLYLGAVKKKGIAEELELHIMAHIAQAEQKIQIRQELLKRRQMLLQQAAQQKGNGATGIPQGNRTQPSPMATSGDMASGIRA